MKTTHIAVLCMTCWLTLLSGCSLIGGANSDIEFAKTAFTSLARGDSSAADMIDWETFRSTGINAGMLYTLMPDDKEKAAFRESFIAQFSSSFQATGASADNLKNWRIESRDSARTVVAADTPKGATLTITVSQRDGKQRISAIEGAEK